MDKILRTWSFNPEITLRNEESDENDFAGEFKGHAAVFNQETLIGSQRFGFVERIATNAFESVLEQDVRLLMNHEGLPLARTKNDTLSLSEDEIGLMSEARIANTSEGRDVVTLLQRGDVDQMSFGFTIAEQSWGTYESDDDLNGMDLRTVTKIGRLFDVSVVTFPAYEGTDAGLRSLEVSESEITEALRMLRSEDEVKLLADEARADEESTLQFQMRLLSLARSANEIAIAFNKEKLNG